MGEHNDYVSKLECEQHRRILAETDLMQDKHFTALETKIVMYEKIIWLIIAANIIDVVNKLLTFIPKVYGG